MTRPILVFGAGGRVGGELGRLGARLNAELVGMTLQLCDITDAWDVLDLAKKRQPRAIINLAAITLPEAEMEGSARDDAFRVNAIAIANLAACRVPVITLSTDCVFDGLEGAPYDEWDRTDPINWYGLSKEAGERVLRNVCDIPHIILRTTGVYLRGKPNFLETVLSKARAGETLECVSDSIYSPTDARELARAILTATERVIEDPSVSGTYHFAGPDVMSYLDFARLVQEEAGVAGEIVPVTMADRETVEGFKRPRNATLNSDKFAETFGLRHRPTRECLRELVNPAA